MSKLKELVLVDNGLLDATTQGGILEQVQDSFSCTVDVYGPVVRGTKHCYTMHLSSLEDGSCFEVSIIFTPYEHYSQIGIHLKEADEGSLSNALEQAERDGFQTIYIHSLAS